MSQPLNELDEVLNAGLRQTHAASRPKRGETDCSWIIGSTEWTQTQLSGMHHF